MRNFQDTFETHKRQFIIAFSICMTVTLRDYFLAVRTTYPKTKHKK